MSRLQDSQRALLGLFQRHVQAELDGDLETTMATMTDAPHLNHVPTMMGGAKDCKVSHEHIYGDQACVLVQLGLLDPTGLPTDGAEAARKVLDPRLPGRLDERDVRPPR